MRRILLPLLLAIVLGVGLFWWITRPLPILTVITWPGPYGRAQAAAMMHPYGADKHIDVRPAQYDGGLAELTQAVATHAYGGDVIDMELPDAVAACRKGLLEQVDAATLPPGADGLAAAKDFVPGAVGPCWVGAAVYSHVLIFAPGKFTDAPATVADFFDLAKFPGRRALHSGAKYNLELALLADGVPPAQVYSTLATPAGLARAFAKLATIRAALVWMPDAGNAIDLVRTGQVAFASAMSGALAGDIFDPDLHGFAPGVIWDRQLYEMDVLAVPKADPKLDRAMDYLRYATGSAPLAGVASWVALGPPRRSSLPLVSVNPELKNPMAPLLPTLPAHFATAFAVDDGWWLDHGDAIAPRWQAFIDGAD